MGSNATTHDFEFLKLLLKCDQQDYNELKEECLRKDILFEDDLFGACSSSYYLPNTKIKTNSNIKWLRPHQLVSSSDEKKEPRFMHQLQKQPQIDYDNVNLTATRPKHFRYQLNFVRGRYGSSNLIQALSVLYWHPDTFAHVVPEDQSFESYDYAGIFHFHIWQYGRWHDVVVDDRLPTMNGNLVQVHSYKNAEFWPALLEKAFAKLNGCYQALNGCQVNEFLEDMTGGLCESINSTNSEILNEGLFRTLCQSLESNSHIIARISDDPSIQDPSSLSKSTSKCKRNQKQSHLCAEKRKLNNGLIKKQSYIVLGAKQLDHLDPDKVVHLILLCNPWKRLNQIASSNKCTKCSTEGAENGTSQSESAMLNDGKWLGSWSEHSAEWIDLTDEYKVQNDLVLDNDSQFWMPIESFVECFTEVYLCHVEGGGVNRQGDLRKNERFNNTAPVGCTRWHSIQFNGYWLSGVSAGGCFNQETFHTNPIYLIPIHEDNSKGVAKANRCSSKNSTNDKNIPSEICYTVLVGLMQKYRSSKRLIGIPDLRIGFHLFRLDLEDRDYIEELIYDNDYEMALHKTKVNCEKFQIRLKMKPEFFHQKKAEHVIQYFTNVREVSARYSLPVGNYLLIPSTYGPNCDGSFLLRLYCESAFKFSSHDAISLVNLQSQTSDSSTSASKSSVSLIQHPKVQVNKTYLLDQLFSRPTEKIGTQGETVDVEHLEILLKSVIYCKRNYFSLDQCLSLLALYDWECKGNLSYAQVQHLCLDINDCYQLFVRHDKTVSRTISSSELKAALGEMGIQVNPRVLEMLLNRYGSKSKIVVKGVSIRELKFPSFALCVLKLRKLLIYWDIKLTAHQDDSNMAAMSSGESKQITSSNFTLLEFVKQVIYS